MAIRCSWSLGEDIPFTISMTAGGNRFGQIRVEIEEEKRERSRLKPM
jgi:hypothetical protein